MRSSCTFSFRSSRTFFLKIFLEAAARSLKNKKYSQKQPHICLNKKIYSEADGHIFFSEAFAHFS